MSQPFYWTAVADPPLSAPSGWYQWTDRGLIYLGESILDQMSERAGKAES